VLELVLESLFVVSLGPVPVPAAEEIFFVESKAAALEPFDAVLPVADDISADIATGSQKMRHMHKAQNSNLTEANTSDQLFQNRDQS
jgi:hypothetical protein